MKKIVYYYSAKGLYFRNELTESDSHASSYPDPTAKELIATCFLRHSCLIVKENAVVLETSNSFVMPVFKILVNEESLGVRMADGSRSLAADSSVVVLATNYGDVFHDVVFPKKDAIYFQNKFFFDATRWCDLTIQALSAIVRQYTQDGFALSWWEESKILLDSLSAIDATEQPLSVKANSTFLLVFNETKKIMQASKFNVRGTYFAVMMVVLEYFQTIPGSEHLNESSLKLLDHWQKQIALITELVAYIDSFSGLTQFFKFSYKDAAKELLQKVFHAADSNALAVIIKQNQHLIVEITGAGNALAAKDEAASMRSVCV